MCSGAGVGLSVSAGAGVSVGVETLSLVSGFMKLLGSRHLSFHNNFIEVPVAFE